MLHSEKKDDFVEAKFYCPYAVANSNSCIQISEKTPEFSTALPAPSPYHPYHVLWMQHCDCF